ncbi:MAG: thioredoxin [Mollicutes bacterium]|nr:thioredoxin [Mollicutes bacterium]
MIIIGNKEDYNELIMGDLVLVDFFAKWCGPCKMLGQVLEEISNERNDLIIVKIDVDENPDLAKLNGVMSVPTLILFKNGNVVARQSGFMPKEILNKWIDENK